MSQDFAKSKKEQYMLLKQEKIEFGKNSKFIGAVGNKQEGVGGVMVSIVAFQAVDPGSIPGQRKASIFSHVNFTW